MDAFEEYDPYPELAGFRADLPHAGRYGYDPVHSVMYNSGLVATRPARHLAAIEDAVVLIDAMLDAGNRSFKIEQISFSESFRLHEAPLAEMRPLFQHYFRRSTKRYMHWRIDRWLKRSPDFETGPPFIAHSRNVVRIFNYINQVTKKY